jgi:hypothetical protein
MCIRQRCCVKSVFGIAAHHSQVDQPAFTTQLTVIHRQLVIAFKVNSSFETRVVCAIHQFMISDAGYLEDTGFDLLGYGKPLKLVHQGVLRRSASFKNELEVQCVFLPLDAVKNDYVLIWLSYAFTSLIANLFGARRHSSISRIICPDIRAGSLSTEHATPSFRSARLRLPAFIYQQLVLWPMICFL